MAPVFPNRMAKCRAKKKENEAKWNEYLEKDKLRNRVNRTKQKNRISLDSKLLEEKRNKDRERQRLCRLRKKEAKTNVTDSKLGTYKSPNTLGKAVKRVKKTLPISPGKKVAVLKQLINENFDKNVCQSLFNLTQSRTGPRKLTEECRQTVLDFFHNDEISRQAPGKADVKSVKDPRTGKRNLKQIRHMVMGIKEAYEEFKTCYPEMIISRSKFFSLRPKNILPVGNMPHNVCVCRYHANATHLIEAIFKCDASFPKTHKALLEAVCCNTAREECMNNNCKKCVYDLKTLLSKDCDLNHTCKWKQWQEIDKRPSLVEKSTTLGECVQELNKQLQFFKIHCFTKKKQATYFDVCKNTIKDNPSQAVMQIDFAENFSLIHQDEIQSAHWSHSQVTIFTCCLWHKTGVKSYVVVSNDLKHSKYSVWVFLKSIFAEVKKELPEINHIYLFSDNCAAQFKSRFSVTNICHSKDDFGVTIEWDFFASGHGKGAVDGLGGTVKRLVWRAVQGRLAIINSAVEFYNFCASKCKGIKALYVCSEYINKFVPQLDKRWENLSPIPKIQSSHHFQIYDKEHILVGAVTQSEMLKVAIYKEKSKVEKLTQTLNKKRLRYEDVYSSNTSDDDEEFKISSAKMSHIGGKEHTHSDQPVTLTPGTFVLVQLVSSRGNTYRYVGVCQSNVHEDGDIDILYLKKYNNSNKEFVINEADEKKVSSQDVLRVLEVPKMVIVGRERAVYQFSEAPY